MARTLNSPVRAVLREKQAVMKEREGARIIDGRAIAKAICREIRQDVQQFRELYNRAPGLAVVIVGERKESQTYVRMRNRACAEVGIQSFAKVFPANTSEEKLLRIILELNDNPLVDGILVQLPLPQGINEERVLSAVSLQKDVDGLHPVNVAKLCMKGRTPQFVPSTPKGCIDLLDRCGISIAKKRAVVVGRSNIVGLPAAMLLLERDATVSIVHSRTPDPEIIIKDADIIIAAAGQAHMIKSEWIKPGAAVIDVGANALTDPSRRAGYRLVGDVDFEGARKVAGWITPVPGGVGPMTIAMLLRNTLYGALASASIQDVAIADMYL